MTTQTLDDVIALFNKRAAALDDRDLDAATAASDFMRAFDVLDGIAEHAEAIEDEARMEAAETLRDMADAIMVALEDNDTSDLDRWF